ncbi:glycosyl hydrolase, partial [Bacteroidota bacterium]
MLQRSCNLAVPFNENKIIDSTGAVINVSGNYENDTLNWIVPDGKWVILRFINSNTGQRLISESPNSDGPQIDFFAPEVTIRYLQYVLDKLGISPENASDFVLKYIFFDSMELARGFHAWTDSMRDIFKERQGYDMEKYLPILADWQINDVTERFLYDWYKTVSDQFIFSHYFTGREFLKKYNIDFNAEAGGPGPPVWESCPVDALKAIGNVTVPCGEFWVRHRSIFLVKEIASGVHIYGKKTVDAESFTTWRRWKDGPYDFKKIVDRAFCEGLNKVTLNTFANTNPEDGYPGRTVHAGSDFNPAITWWEKAKPFMDYLGRCSYLLQQGLFVADVCYYYGDQAPNFFPAFHDVPEKPMLDGLGKGYDYDVVNSDVILNRMSVNDGKIVLPDGMSYSIMILPDTNAMPLPVLNKIASLIDSGATVIGPMPTQVPGLMDYENKNSQIAELAAQIWGDIDGIEKVENVYGQGKIINGLTPEEILVNKGIAKDFSFEGMPELDYIHRIVENNDIYFVRNKDSVWYNNSCTFRVSGKNPAMWDPATGRQVAITEYQEENGTTRFNLNLPPYGTVFIVFTANQIDYPDQGPLWINPEETEITTFTMSGSWNVTFPEGWGAPPEKRFPELKSWTEFEEDGIKYFSGTATYHNSIVVDQDNINENDSVVIDLGEVRDVAEVYINDSSAGILWKKPYAVNITDLLKPGENALKIEVVNLWINRLSGDMLLDPEDRFCRTNQPYITENNQIGSNPEWEDQIFHIQPAGLIGPVKLISTVKLIGKIDQTIIFDSLVAQTYSDEDFILNASASSGLPVSFSSSDTTVIAIEEQTAKINGAGTVSITASQDGNTNYHPAAEVKREMTVSKALLTITAKDTSRFYGEVNPEIELLFSGFIHDDNENDIDELPVAETYLSTVSAPGTYEIYLSGGSDDDYDFIYVNGTFIIKPNKPDGIKNFNEKNLVLYPNPVDQ